MAAPTITSIRFSRETKAVLNALKDHPRGGYEEEWISASEPEPGYILIRKPPKTR